MSRTEKLGLLLLILGCTMLIGDTIFKTPGFIGIPIDLILTVVGSAMFVFAGKNQ